jgi:hypothetical protein
VYTPLFSCDSVHGHTISTVRYYAPPSPPLSFPLLPRSPLSLLSFCFSLPFRVFHCPLWAPFRHIRLRPMWGFTGSLGGLRLFENNELLMCLVSSLWQMVWKLHPTLALPLERFRSESLMLFPACLRLNLFEHLIVVCSCARIA